MVGANTLTYVASLGDDNDVNLNGTFLDTYQAGDTFTITTSAGDILECSEGCYAITPIDGTAAWSTQLYASTLLSTYMGRYATAKIAVAAFDNASTISIKQVGSTLVDNELIPSNSVREFYTPFTDKQTLWIESDYEIAAYISTEKADSPGFHRDGRVTTAPAKVGLAFVAGAGGTPTGISVIQDGTTFDIYRDDGTNFLSETLDVSGFLDVTNSAVGQNRPGSAIAFYADAPIVSTQHADGDGTNASPSLSKNMLSTHFVAPMDGDYVSFAAFDDGQVLVIDDSNNVISVLELDRDGSANSKAPFSATYNPTNSNVDRDIRAGYRFVASVPVLGIFEEYENNDETLMTGVSPPAWELVSTDFASNGQLPYITLGNDGSSCNGPNSFPNPNLEQSAMGS